MLFGGIYYKHDICSLPFCLSIQFGDLGDLVVGKEKKEEKNDALGVSRKKTISSEMVFFLSLLMGCEQNR